MNIGSNRLTPQTPRRSILPQSSEKFISSSGATWLAGPESRRQGHLQGKGGLHLGDFLGLCMGDSLRDS